MISYLIQVGLTLLFGPVLVVLDLCIKPRTSPLIIKHPYNLLMRLLSPFCEINAFFCISVLVAGLVRFMQTPPIFEIDFLNVLIQTQTAIMFETVVSAIWLWHRRRKDKLSLILIYFVMVIVAQMAVTYANAIPSSAFPIYSHLAIECHDEYGYIDFSSQFNPEVASKGGYKWIGIGAAIGVGSIIFLFLLFALLGTFVAWCRRLWSQICLVWFRSWLKSHWRQLGVFLLALWFISILPFFATKLQRRRAIVENSIGESFQANEWGYGQTTALLLWAPLLRRAFNESWGKYSVWF